MALLKHNQDEAAEAVVACVRTATCRRYSVPSRRQARQYREEESHMVAMNRFGGGDSQFRLGHHLMSFIHAGPIR